MLRLGHNFFGSLFHLAGFRIVFVDDLRFNLARGQFAGFDDAFVFCIVVNVFDFNFDILRVIIFRRFHLGTDFDNVFYRIFFVGFLLRHFAVGLTVFNGLLVLYIIGAFNALLNFLARTGGKFTVISDFHFKRYFEGFRVLHFAFEVCGAHFDDGVHRFIFGYFLLVLNNRIYNGPLRGSGAEFALLFHAVDGLVSPLALLKVRIDDHLGFKGKHFRVGVGAVGHGADSYNLIDGFFIYFRNRVATVYNFTVYYFVLRCRGFQTVFSGLLNFFFTGL